MHRNRLLSKLKEGLIDMDFLTGKKKSMSEKKKQPSDEPFVLWKGDEEDELTLRKGPQHVQAPKMKPPGHAESYNPAEEYLPTEEELKAWEDLDEVDRPYGALVPQKFKNLRTVGAYQHSVKERFERCLDLYLAPRMIKKRLNIDPESLVPKLPSPKDLKPFPNAKCIVYSTATSCKSMVRAISVSPSGEYFASGSEDGYVRVWEVMTGKMVREWGLHKFANVEDSATETVVSSVEWNPNSAHHVLLVGVGKAVVVIRTDTGCRADEELTSALLEVGLKGGGKLNPKAEKACAWERAPGGGGGGGGGGACHRDQTQQPREKRKVPQKGRLLRDNCFPPVGGLERPDPPTLKGHHSAALQQEQGRGADCLLPPKQTFPVCCQPIVHTRLPFGQAIPGQKTGRQCPDDQQHRCTPQWRPPRRRYPR